MAPIAKEPDAMNSARSNAGATTPPSAKPQPAAAEIPVTVNGARTVEGSDKREPFSENTQTVLVFANGAVIRLSSPVASGQLLFLTNEKTKKEVVCQVVKSKNYSNVSGYVELEFTEAAPGFWGLRFPTNGQALSAPSAVKPMASAPAPSGKSLEEKIAETKAKMPAAPATTTEAKESPKEGKVASVVQVQSPSTASKIPTLSEFLTQGESGPALKAPEREKPGSMQQKPDADIHDLKRQAAKLQDQLSSKAFTEPVKESEKRDSLTNLLLPSSVKQNPAPGTSTFDFAADEVKIPAWLEPLARNSAPNFAPHESKVPVTIELDAKSPDTKTGEANASEAFQSESAKREQSEVDSSSVDILADDPAKHEAVFTLSGEGPTPNFGSSLALDAISASPEHSSKGSGQGLILGVAAAALLFAAGGGWYWYSNQPKDVSANAISTPQNNFGAPAVSGTAPAAAIPENIKPSSGSLLPNSDANRSSVTPQTIRTENREAGSFATGISKPAASASAATKTNVEDRSFSPAPVAEPVKKPSFGNVHLAAPTASRRVSPSDSNAADAAPSLSGTSDVAGDSGGLNVLANKVSQPAAPLPIGGNVKPAQLLSSVAPAYPQLARNQRLSGDVKIDALIGENGHVSAMKVISGPALLHQAAMDALRQWKYQPATLNGQPMAMHLTVTVQFKLQ
jgi:periplasmic protein TonB